MNARRLIVSSYGVRVNMKKRNWAISYTLLVTIFAFIYWFLWIYKPDSFIVNKELNLYPLSDAYEMLWGETPYHTAYTVSLDELKLTFDELNEKLQNNDKAIESIEENMRVLEIEEDSISERKEKELDENITKYKSKNIAPFIEKDNEYKSRIEVLEKQLKSLSDPYKRLDVIKEVSNEKVDYSKFRIKMAQKEYEIATDVHKNMAAFISQETLSKLNQMQENRMKYYQQSSDYQKNIGEIRMKVSDFLRSHFDSRKERLSLIDFIYFSIGISTTTTLGDITANGKLARAIVCFQLILCVFIIAGFVDAEAYKRANKANSADAKSRAAD